MLTALGASDAMRCTCCGCAASVIDEGHGALCRDCLEELIAIRETLDSLAIE